MRWREEGRNTQAFAKPEKKFRVPKKNWVQNKFGSKEMGPKKFWIKKNLVKKIWFQNIFGSKKIWRGGGVKTVGTSSLDYRKPTYQILASYYA